MAKQVVIAEKPSVARDMARVLNCTQKGAGYFEGASYIVTWALGHLVTLADPETYDQKYKTWNLSDLPMVPEKLSLTVIKQSGKQFQAVKKQLQRADVSGIIIATDAGREGELVARWIIEKAKVKKPMKRLWISSVTDKAIKEGFQKLQPAAKYETLYHAAVARSEADWYVGLNATRALTTKFNAQLNAGRVQTPVIALIEKREQEIQSFQPQTFYGIDAVTKDGLTLHWRDAKTNQSRSFNRDDIKKRIEKMGSEAAIVKQVSKKMKKQPAPALYDLTELQRDANRLFDFSAKETLSTLQGLYERHKMVTYPRTDSRYLSSDIVATIPDRLRAIALPAFRPITKQVLQKLLAISKSFVDDKRVTDHHAIIPTEESGSIQKLSDRERKIYELIVKRFVAVLLPAKETEQVTVEATIAGEIFTAKAENVVVPGWEIVYQADKQAKDQRLQGITVGQKLAVQFVTETTGQTKPPAPYTEGTLLTAMENPTQLIDSSDKQLAQTLKATGGLGTVATRADIIEKLFNAALIEKRGQAIHTTGKGRQLLALVPPALKSAELTGEWEQKLEQIAKGSASKDAFVKEVKAYTKELVQEIKQSDATFKHDNLTGKTCPDCGKALLEVNGKKGKMLVCQDRACGYRKNVARVTNARCPECHKKLEMVGEGDGQLFVCKNCGFREKLTTFQAKKKTQGKKADKRDVQKFLKNQQKEEPVNNALFDALKGLKLDD